MMDLQQCLLLGLMLSVSYVSTDDSDEISGVTEETMNVMDLLKHKSLDPDPTEGRVVMILKRAILELQETVEGLQGRLNFVEKHLWSGKGSRRRSRRSVEQELPSANCTPGTIGCPGAYTPYVMGQCFLCPPGPPGPQGSPGTEGERGRDGRDGQDGDRGSKGDNGVGDSTSVSDNQPTSSIPSSTHAGVIYIRWGRSECPSTSELVYGGVAGGEHYTHKGGASNYLCLPNEPIYDEPEGTAHADRGYIYGAEYETTTYPPYAHLHNNEVPCAVCKAVHRSSYLMVPARNECPGPEWTREYSGHLMSDHRNHWKKEYVCMDRNAEAVPRTAPDVNGALFYPTEGRCSSSGGIPCGPYINGYELTCAVCTL